MEEICKVGMGMQNFEGLVISSAIEQDIQTPPLSRIAIANAVPNTDSTSKICALKNDIIFAEQVAQMRTFTGHLDFGKSFVSPELEKK